MLYLLGNLRKQFKPHRVHIDGNVFHLCTSATVAVLLSFCTLLTAWEYVGTPIECHYPTIPAGVVKSFCWLESTLSHQSLFNASYNDSVIYPGTGHKTKGSGSEDQKYHTYYQWTCFLLFAQADRAEDRSQMSDFLVVSLSHNHWYLINYLICELLSVLNVVVQVAFTDYVLGGSFLAYGWDLVRWHRGEGRQFIAMCTFKYGQSCRLENLEAICVLPLSMSCSRSCGSVAYRVLFMSAPLRRRLLGWRYPNSQRISAIVSSCRPVMFSSSAS
ncbi:hypothetical protein HPB48_018772 [Haemaphysalis longicornis]|uniref:Innexin n=1 Tax=Haemaphysalis longicornis TaxID=44386 RepID=A0A9J6GN76_HAELO|nr:hypothetical protein HPB48_018772 [Haemaphysalis longicornis]